MTRSPIELFWTAKKQHISLIHFNSKMSQLFNGACGLWSKLSKTLADSLNSVNKPKLSQYQLYTYNFLRTHVFSPKMHLCFIFCLLCVPCIPYICPFFYASRFYSLKIFHPKVRNFATKIVSRENSVYNHSRAKFHIYFSV